MRLWLDRTVCEGFGTCAARAPRQFSLDDWGYATLATTGEVPVEDRHAARRAILDCPVHAIAVLPDGPLSERPRP